MEAPFYQLEAKALNGETIAMKEYQGKYILVVNTASKCGLTPQYEGLEQMHKNLNAKGLVILGFPCNQFGNQEPGDEDSIARGCLLNYGVSFPMFSKIEVNGEQTHPIYKYLKSELKGLLGDRIKWNFTKFLIDPNGKPLKRFAPTTKPEEIENYISSLMD